MDGYDGSGSDSTRTTAGGDADARANWDRYQYVRQRGHREYIETAARNERFYLGGGGQWSEEDKAKLEAAGRPAYEFNEIMPAINAALGHQIQNRLDITYLPVGGAADMDSSTMFSKVVKQITEECKLKWAETQVLGDGLIQQRGYFDVRMHFDDSFKGNIVIEDRDPADVIPDPDAKTYHPNGWADVVVTRWLLGDEIEQLYGAKARANVEANAGAVDSGDADFGVEDGDQPRSKFGAENGSGSRYWDSTLSGATSPRRYRVVDRQYWVYEMTQVVVDTETGDVAPAVNPSPEQLADWQARGLILSKRMQRRVMWVVSTPDVLLHKDYSPYPFFTIIPYFPIFRRGQTRGLVDNAIGPQEALNKSVSQYVHIINSTANSGWVVEENSLTNMELEELEDEGAATGLVIEYAKNTEKPEKIQPNTIPSGIDKLIDRTTQAVRAVTVPEAMRGEKGPEISGLAIQSKQHAAQTQLAVPLDNLARTRHMLAERIRDLVQMFYDDPRVFRITEDDPKTGKKVTTEIAVNQMDEAGNYRNDLTTGKYDMTISEVPMQATFENNQFFQALEIKKVCPSLPDSVVIKHSNLTEKYDILEQMSQPPPPSEIDGAKAALLRAQTKKTENDAVGSSITAQFESIQAARTIAAMPQTAPLADQLLKSGGFVDQDAPPIVGAPAVATPGANPNPGGNPLAAMPAAAPPLTSTDPLHPAHADVGIASGIEGGQHSATPLPKI